LKTPTGAQAKNQQNKPKSKQTKETKPKVIEEIEQPTF